MSKINRVLVGVSGEYFVAAELSKIGYIASITLRNTKGVDILCSNSDATKTVGIQVKTNYGSNNSWILDKKAENYIAGNLFYVFVNLNKGQSPPKFFIVPSQDVASYVKNGHIKWLSNPKHKNTSMRKFDIVKGNEGKYLNSWDLLGL